MKIFINTDLEGACEVNSMEMVKSPTHPKYAFAYENLAYDVNAAAEGAFLAGAEEVYVIDGHGAGGLSKEILDKRIKFIERPDWVSPHFMECLHNGFDGIFFIGGHAMAGTQNAFLEHTMSSMSWFDYKINGKRVGELGIHAAVSGEHDIPTIFVTGDEAYITEARELLGNIEAVAVKRGIGRNKCELYNSKIVREKIKFSAQKATENLKNGIKNYKIYKPSLPARISLTFFRADFCDEVCEREMVERIDARTVEKTINTFHNSNI